MVFPLASGVAETVFKEPPKHEYSTTKSFAYPEVESPHAAISITYLQLTF